MPGDETRIIKGINPNTHLPEVVQVINGQLQTNAAGGGDGTITNYDDFDFAPTLPAMFSVTLVLANTEYEVTMPVGCRGFEFQARTSADVRWAFETGHVAGSVAPYNTLKSGSYYWSFPLNQGAAPSTLYFASTAAGTVVEGMSWE